MSFTSDQARAERFAVGEGAGTLVALSPDAPQWDASIFTFDSARLERCDESSPGIYAATFSHRRAENLPLPQFSMGAIARAIADTAIGETKVRLVMLDVPAVLRHARQGCDDSFAEAIRNAERDAEWLLLPADPFHGAAGSELTALLDDSCISRREKFALR